MVGWSLLSWYGNRHYVVSTQRLGQSRLFPRRGCLCKMWTSYHRYYQNTMQFENTAPLLRNHGATFNLVARVENLHIKFHRNMKTRSCGMSLTYSCKTMFNSTWRPSATLDLETFMWPLSKSKLAYDVQNFIEIG